MMPSLVQMRRMGSRSRYLPQEGNSVTIKYKYLGRLAIDGTDNVHLSHQSVESGLP